MVQLTTIYDANRYLAQFYDNSRTPYTLDNMHVLMDHLDNPQDKLRIVHIAGTSGKTSTAYYVSTLLTAASAKTGLTVSPHVDSLTERIQINSQLLSETVFCAALSEYLTIIESVPVEPSWFEIMVSFAYWYFAREAVDYAVVEVGLGGLLDGTNVVSRPDKLCLIADIGLDHTQILGDSLAEIASQKAGIIQPHNLVLMNHQTPEVMAVFEKYCREHDATLRIIPKEPSPGHDLPAYQARNWKLAHQAFLALQERDHLPHLTDEVLQATRRIVIPGRMYIRQRDGKTVIMDGAHNAQKMTAFLDSFQQLYPGQKPAVLVAVKEGKEYQDIVPLLAGVSSRLIVTSFDTSQDTPIHSMEAQTLAQAFQATGKDCEVIADPVQAYQALLESTEPLVIITGSFYLLSQIRNNEAIR